MNRIMAAIRAIMAAIKTVWEPVLEAGVWTMKAVTKVTAPVIHAADAVIDSALSIPGRMLAGIKSSSGRAGQQAQAAGQQTDAQVRKMQAENEAALTTQQTARILQKVAKWRSEGKEVDSLLEALPAPLQAYVRSLSTGECVRLADTDARAVVDWLGGKRGPIPGVRTPDEVITNRVPKAAPAPAPAGRTSAPGVDETPEQAAVLDTLSARILARATRPEDTVVRMERRVA